MVVVYHEGKILETIALAPQFTSKFEPRIMRCRRLHKIFQKVCNCVLHITYASGSLRILGLTTHSTISSALSIWMGQWGPGLLTPLKSHVSLGVLMSMPVVTPDSAKSPSCHRRPRQKYFNKILISSHIRSVRCIVCIITLISISLYFNLNSVFPARP